MTLVKTKPELVTLQTFRSNGVKEELTRHLIENNVRVSTELRLEIRNSTSSLITSITSGVEYHPVVIPVNYFVHQNISLCNDNKWYIPEVAIYRQAKELGLAVPPAELAFLIAANPPADHPELADFKNLAIMSKSAKGDVSEMTVSLKRKKTFLDTVWKNTIQEVRHIHLWKIGLVFLRESKQVV